MIDLICQNKSSVLILNLMINLIEVTKSNNESNASLLRRFSRRVRSSGYVNKVKGLKYNQRAKSELKKKQEALNRIKKRAEREHLKKLGRIKDVGRK